MKRINFANCMYSQYKHSKSFFSKRRILCIGNVDFQPANYYAHLLNKSGLGEAIVPIPEANYGNFVN